MVHSVIRFKRMVPHVLLELSHFDFVTISNQPILLSFGYDYYAVACIVIIVYL